MLWPLPCNGVCMRGSPDVRPSLRSFTLLTLYLCGLLTAGAYTLGCGGGGASTVAPPPPPPPPPVIVTVTPAVVSVLIGTTRQFSAEVKNTSNIAVTWSVAGITGGNATVGTITAQGIYTAPQILPAQVITSITATSSADARVSDSARVTIGSDISVVLSPSSASVELGAMKEFSVAINSAGHFDTSIRWSLSGAGCLGESCGTVDSSGRYTAPRTLPSPADVTLTAQSVADPSKYASALAHMTSGFTVSMIGPTSVMTGSTAEFTARIEALAGSNPSGSISWQLTGSGCAGAGCGTILASPGPSSTSVAVFTAPAVAPIPNIVLISALPTADPSKATSKTISIIPMLPEIKVRLTPPNATLAVSHRQILNVQVTGTSNKSVAWQVNGVPGGNTVVGQICVAASSPCQPVTISTDPTVDYLAPSSVPQPNPVTILATSQADSSQFASMPVTVLAHLVVGVSPPSVTVAPNTTQQFSATVQGTANQNVIWQLQGTGCSGTGAPCGVINANGVYAAPLFAPSPNTLLVVAISVEDTEQRGFSQVTVSTGANIMKLLPASVFAGATGGFTLRVQGSGFVATVPGPGSAIEVGGVSRSTNCLSTGDCTTTLSAADVSSAGNLPVQVRNPSGTPSNQVMLVALQPVIGSDVIALTPAAPSATGKDITTVEPSTAGTSAAGTNVDLSVAAMGVFSISTSSCSLGGNPLPLARPASGLRTHDLCLFSMSGLEAGMDYTISGPGDVAVIGKQPVGLGIIHLTLQISSSATPGPRTIFIENSNKDKAAASGALEVK